MTTARQRLETDTAANAFRQRLLNGLAESITEVGYRDTTVADIVRGARTSRRTFYEHFAGRDECFVALIRDHIATKIEQIAAAVDPTTPWEIQVRQAIGAWITHAESHPAITLSWIRDVPLLGDTARQLHRDALETLVGMIRTLSDTEAGRAASGGSLTSRQTAIILIGGLAELIADTVEHGRRISDITEAAVQAALALLPVQPGRA